MLPVSGEVDRKHVGQKGENVMCAQKRWLFPVILGVAVAAWAAHARLAASQPQAASSSEDPQLGTWHLVVSKSTYDPGPPPKSQTRLYEKHRFGITATVRTVHADGRSTTVQTVYDYDNMEHPVTGSEEVDAVVMTRVNAYTSEATLSHAGREIGTFRRVISRDGKQMTVTLQRNTPRANNVEVYEKEDQ
jgi:hypothetical protein